MDNIADNKNGFIVFADGCTNSLSYGASEKWFPTYDEATQYAIELVSKRTAESKEGKWVYSVMVYEAEESTLEKSHSCPCGRVVFQWSNYNK